MPDSLPPAGPVGLLAALPTMIGERPRDRIVVVPLAAHGPGDAWSHALPWRGDHRTTRRVARDLAESISESPGVESMAIVVFCNSTSGGAADRPYEELQRLVSESAHQRRIHLLESFYVAANGWGSYCCDDPRCEYAGPRPIVELEELAEAMGMTF